MIYITHLTQCNAPVELCPCKLLEKRRLAQPDSEQSA